MKSQIRNAWETRTKLERAILLVLAMSLAIGLYAWLIRSSGQARAQLHERVTLLEAQAAQLDAQALEYAHLRASPAPTASSGDLRTLVQARVGEAGLASALTSIEATGANQVRVVFGALPFADWLAWVASLQAQNVRLDICRIEALATPGLVGVSATLMRAGS